MPKHLIERVIPGAGELTADQLKNISQVTCGLLDKMGPRIQWVHSYGTYDKLYRVYIAPNEDIIREHAQLGGFAANSIRLISTMIDPSTAD